MKWNSVRGMVALMLVSTLLLPACGSGEPDTTVAMSDTSFASGTLSDSAVVAGLSASEAEVVQAMVGDQYAVDIPSIVGQKVSLIEDRITIVDADRNWILLLTYSKKAGQTPEEYLQGVDVPLESAQEYSNGNFSGLLYQRKTSDGLIYKVAIVFDSLAAGDAYVGIIELEVNLNVETDDATVYFNASPVTDIIESIRAPE